MKISTAVAAGLLLMAAVPVAGQGNGVDQAAESPYFAMVSSYGETDVQRAKQLYLVSAHSGNDGVAESALAHLVHMRIALPQENMSDVESALLDLAKDGRTHAVRSKAYLARIVFANPAAFSDILDGTFFSGDALFDAIASRLQPSL